MTRFIAATSLFIAFLLPQTSLANEKYFYDAKQCAKLPVTPGERLIEIEEMFQSLLEYSGIQGNFYLCPTRFFSAAFALDASKLEKRVSVKGEYIGYDSSFMKQMRQVAGYWSVYGVLAHELAHHKLGHTLQGRGSHPGIELRADRMAGELMQKSGASLANSLELASLAFLQNGGKTHPNGEQRRIAYKGGWLNGCQIKASPQCPGYKRKEAKVVDDKNYDETQGYLQLRTLAEKYKGAKVTNEYCRLYASVGVKQTQRNISNQCGYLVDASNNSRWSLDFTGQYHWCLTASAYATDKENIFRESQLKKCLSK